MGVTTQEFEKMLEAGLSAEEFLPKFAKALREDVRETGALGKSLKTITAAQQRFTAQLQLLVLKVFDNGGKEGLVAFFEQMTDALKLLEPVARALGIVVRVVGTVLGTVVNIVSLLLRPLASMLDGFLDIIDITKDANEELSIMETIVQGLIRAYAGLGAVLLEPFILLEKLMDRMEQVKAWGGMQINTQADMRRVIEGSSLGQTLSGSNASSNTQVNFSPQINVNTDSPEDFADNIIGPMLSSAMTTAR